MDIATEDSLVSRLVAHFGGSEELAVAESKHIVRLEKIRNALMAQTPALHNQLIEILQKQFDGANQELGGAIVCDPKQGISFKHIETFWQKINSKAYASFANKQDPDAANFLRRKLLAYVDNLGDHLSEGILTSIEILDQILVAASIGKPLPLEEIDPDREFLTFLHSLICSEYSYISGELGEKDPDFLGIFHCHADGSPPSPVDIESCKKNLIPHVVVSAGTEYAKVGFTSFLIGSDGSTTAITWQGQNQSYKHTALA